MEMAAPFFGSAVQSEAGGRSACGGSAEDRNIEG